MYGIPLKLIGIGISVLALLAGLWGYGNHRYQAGRADEKAVWVPVQIAAEKALAEANARAKTLESAAESITANVEAEHAATITELNARAAAADSRVRALSLRLTSRAASCGREVPTIPDPSTDPNVPTPSEERAFRIGDALTELARRCEYDAASLAALQQWVREQQALANVH